MPAELACRPHIHKSLLILEEAFVHGDGARFEAALIVLLDYCAESVNRGNYEQWW